VIGYEERIWSSMNKRVFLKPLFCFIIAAAFEDKALNYALQKKMRPILIDSKLQLNLISDRNGTNRPLKWQGRLADAQGCVFESVVDQVFKAQGFETILRKKFYLIGNEITEEETTICLTDIDILARKGKKEIHLIECKSAKKQMSRKMIFLKIRNLERITEYFGKKEGYDLRVFATIIGKYNEMDKIEAKRITKIPLYLESPADFFSKNKDLLKGEPKWLFVTDRS
jgi:hypothetical protein